MKTEKEHKMEQLLFGLYKMVDDYFYKLDNGAPENELNMFRNMIRRNRNQINKVRADGNLGKIIHFPNKVE